MSQTSEIKLLKRFDQNVEITGNLTIGGSVSGINTDNFYLDGITKSGNTLTFSVNGATNQTYTFGSNAFTSYTDHSTQGYLTSIPSIDLDDVTDNGATTTNSITVNGLTSNDDITTTGNLFIGTVGQQNWIAFSGTTNDGGGSATYTTTYIGERIYGGTERSELLIYKGNDGHASTASPDRIRMIGANICFDTYNIAQSYPTDLDGVAALTTTRAMTIDSSGNVGIGTSSPAYALEVVTSSNNPIFANTTGTASNIIFNDSNTTANVTVGSIGNDFRVQAGNAERMRIDSSGNVGINTNSPSYKLEVAGQAHIQGILSVSNGQQIRIAGASDGNHFLRKVSTGYSGVTIDGPQLQGHQGGELTTNYTGDNWALRWSIGGNVVINNSLGINTSSVNEKLSVNGAIRTTGVTTSNESSATIAWNNTPNEASFESRGKDNTARGKIVLYQAYANGNNGLRVLETDSSGNVGIGVTPEAWTTFNPVLRIGAGGAIAETGVSNFRMFANTYYDGSYKRIGSGYATQYEQDGYHAWYYASSGAANSTITWSEAMRIANGGNVGIGVTSPTMGLHVAQYKGFLVGNTSNWDSTYISPQNENTINTGYGYNADDGDLWVNYRGYQDGQTKFRNFKVGDGKGNSFASFIGSTGRVGIGTTSPKGRLDIKGGIVFDTKNVSLSTTFTNALTVSLNNHAGVYVKITVHGDWGSHSAVGYVAEFFLQNGGNGYMEPGTIIRQDSNIYNDNIVAQIVDPTGTGSPRDFIIQLKTTSSTGTPFTSFMTYEVKGIFNSVS